MKKIKIALWIMMFMFSIAGVLSLQVNNSLNISWTSGSGDGTMLGFHVITNFSTCVVDPKISKIALGAYSTGATNIKIFDTSGNLLQTSNITDKVAYFDYSISNETGLLIASDPIAGSGISLKVGVVTPIMTPVFGFVERCYFSGSPDLSDCSSGSSNVYDIDHIVVNYTACEDVLPVCNAPVDYVPHNKGSITINFTKYVAYGSPVVNYSVNLYFTPSNAFYGYHAVVNNSGFVNGSSGSVFYNVFGESFKNFNATGNMIKYDYEPIDLGGSSLNLVKTGENFKFGIVAGLENGTQTSPSYCGGAVYMCNFDPNSSIIEPTNGSTLSSNDVFFNISGKNSVCSSHNTYPSNYSITISYINGTVAYSGLINNDFDNSTNFTTYLPDADYYIEAIVTSIQGYNASSGLTFFTVNGTVATVDENKLNLNHCPTTTTAIMLLGIVVLIGGFFIFIGFKNRYGIVSLIGGAMFAACGGILLDCYDFIGFLLILAGFTIILISIFAVRLFK